jgi:putative MATE family efflux protein
VLSVSQCWNNNLGKEDKKVAKESNNIDLANAKVTDLIKKFAGPAIMSSLVGSIYNIADQIFVGQKLGTAGNAATNVAFPITLLMVTIYVIIGSGGASKFSLFQGSGENEKATKTVANSIMVLGMIGVLLAALTLIFTKPMMELFGARDEVLELSTVYTRIIAVGMPFYILGSGLSMYIRADGSPKYAMTSTITGAVLNIVLDPIFIFKLDMGMAGAAMTTVIGQIVSEIISVRYIWKFKTVHLKKEHFHIDWKLIGEICVLGLPGGLNQLAVICVQIAMNNTLGYYGEHSVYGREIPLAVAGIVSKVSSIFNSIVMGISQSCQPIFGYNYGAGNYKRVKETYKQAAAIVTVVAFVAFLLFQTVPRQILQIFQKGNDLYLEFGTAYLRVFMGGICLLGIIILTTVFFPAIGEAKSGMVASLSRQAFQLPLILLLPLVFGMDGVLYAGPIADICTFILCVTLMHFEFKKLTV